MTARQPFTLLCQQLARRRLTARADLHIHTTCSDGTYTPAEIVNLARHSGLHALAITDHDTIDGILPARAATPFDLEVVAGVELTSRYLGRIVHLLAYFFHLDDPVLRDSLNTLRRLRAERFREMVERLDHVGVRVDAGNVESSANKHTLGRRHLAALLVQAGKVGTVREAFGRYLGDRGRVAVPHQGLPLAEAIQTVRNAAGVAALAHPSYDCTREDLLELRGLGLQAVEVDFPSCRRSRSQQLRRWAQELGLAVAGGSDCHGPGCSEVGRGSISMKELEELRYLSIA
jgi:predicted metal-dependent phosphoesterase TrpH